MCVGDMSGAPTEFVSRRHPAHLRDVLGDQTYDSLARSGQGMRTAAMTTYAYDQIDQARTEMKAVSK